MRKGLIQLLVSNLALMLFMFSSSGCTYSDTNIQHDRPSVIQGNIGGGESVTVYDPIENEMRINLSFNEKKVIVRMHDNPTSRDFMSLLSLTLRFEDYAGTEKISYLPRSLSLENAPSGFDPSTGDFALCAPWGNLAVYYKDFGYSSGLISLGVIEAGIENLTRTQERLEVLIEIVEQQTILCTEKEV